MTTQIPAMGRHRLAPMATTITRPTPAPRTAIMVPTISQMVSLSAWAHGTDGAGEATVAGGVVVTDAAGTEEADIMGGAITGAAASITAVAAGTRGAAVMAHAADMVDERVIPGAVDTAHAGISQGVVADMRVVAEEASVVAEEASVAVEVDSTAEAEDMVAAGIRPAAT
jgi:predicted transcriptional regulator